MIPSPLGETGAPASDFEAWFWRRAPVADVRRVLEIAPRGSDATASFRDRFPRVLREDHIRLDVAARPDVDVVGDVHALPGDWAGRFDAVIAIDVWRHLQRPWIAAREIARVLGPGGAFLVGVRIGALSQGEVFAFSREALRLMFEDAGLTVETSGEREGLVGVAGRKARTPGAVARSAPKPGDQATWLRRASDRAAMEALGPGLTDIYEVAPPHPQNAIDLLPGWTHAFPPDLKLIAGHAALYDDPRIHWAVSQFGSLDGARVAELGPLDGAHTGMLERMGARRIDAIEANKTAYLRCLVTKEIQGMRRARFHLGDFVRGLAEEQYYDLIVACGVLYHMADPLKLLERMAARTRAIYLWTHYFDEKEMPPGDPRRGAFRAPETHREVVAEGELAGVTMRMHLRSYHQAWKRSAYCGGPVDRHYWLEKDQLIAALRALGFNQMAFADEQPDHPNGPAFSLFARKETL